MIHKHLQQCAVDNKKDDGYTSASDAGKYLRQHIPDFNPKTYGYKNLTNLLEDFRNLYAIENIQFPVIKTLLMLAINSATLQTIQNPDLIRI